MPEILGHSTALETIRAALIANRVHHAWIFSGPPGIGKYTLACEFARVILDPQAGPDSLGTGATVLSSEDGQLLEAGTHPDLHLVKKEDADYSRNPTLRRRKQANIPLDLLRERMIGGFGSDGHRNEAPAYLTARRGQGKVFIIDESELIDINGQNALLKTLEEPPPRTWIFLVTSSPERLLSTVQSRCIHIRTGTLSEDDMQTWIQKHLDNVPDLDWLLRWSQGSPGMAELADRTNIYSAAQTLDPILADLDRGLWHESFGSEVTSFISDWADQQVKESSNASKDVANKQAAGLIFRYLALHARSRITQLSVDGATEARQWWNLANCLAEAEDQVNRGSNLKHVMEGLAAGWCQICTPPRR